MRELILGGVKSGKSRLGAEIADSSGLDVIYVATATAGDEEMCARIARHRRERPRHWGLVEEPVHLASALLQLASPSRCLLVDCLTLWLSNLLHDAGESTLSEQTGALLDTVPKLPGRLVMIANETGLGVIPANALARRFCDEAGSLNQQLAVLCDRVTLVSAGLPIHLKG